MKIAMLVSGGVDSSVALNILHEQGHDITAFYLKIWLEDEMSFLGECPWEDDLSYIEAICKNIDVPLEVVPFQKEYWERIVSYTLDEVKEGRTPNPDVLCNTRVKFGAFYEYIQKEYGSKYFDAIASGHYAQTEHLNGVAYLKSSPDITKDQTYFLSQLKQEQVAHALFPIGGMLKSEVRERAKQFQLPNASRPDSQGLCFLGKIRFDDFLEFHLGKRTGDIIDKKTGKKLGEHNGFWYYTIGQRKGIKLSGGPWYVVEKDAEKNIVYISNAYRSEDSARNTLEVERVNWISKNPFMSNSGKSIHAMLVKLRHGAAWYACKVEKQNENSYKVTLDGFDTGIAPGQFAVFYEGEYCLGSGVIKENQMFEVENRSANIQE